MPLRILPTGSNCTLDRHSQSAFFCSGSTILPAIQLWRFPTARSLLFSLSTSFVYLPLCHNRPIQCHRTSSSETHSRHHHSERQHIHSLSSLLPSILRPSTTCCPISPKTNPQTRCSGHEDGIFPNLDQWRQQRTLELADAVIEDFDYDGEA